MATALDERQCLVPACSALKRCYRLRFRGVAPELSFIFMKADHATLMQRVAHRAGHAMPAMLLDSQLADSKSRGMRNR